MDAPFSISLKTARPHHRTVPFTNTLQVQCLCLVQFTRRNNDSFHRSSSKQPRSICLYFVDRRQKQHPFEVDPYIQLEGQLVPITLETALSFRSVTFTTFQSLSSPSSTLPVSASSPQPTPSSHPYGIFSELSPASSSPSRPPRRQCEPCA